MDIGVLGPFLPAAVWGWKSEDNCESWVPSSPVCRSACPGACRDPPFSSSHLAAGTQGWPCVFLLLFLVWPLGILSHALMLSWQALYPPIHLFCPLIQNRKDRLPCQDELSHVHCQLTIMVIGWVWLELKSTCINSVRLPICVYSLGPCGDSPVTSRNLTVHEVNSRTNPGL